MKAIHFLSEYGRICQVEEFKNLSLRVANVSDEERLSIFNFLFLAESVVNMNQYDWQSIHQNKHYTLDTAYVNKIVEEHDLYFLWEFSTHCKSPRYSVFLII